MTTEELSYFRITATIQNLTKAAEKLFISQSALSRIIGRLENELGVELFDRVGKTLILNEYGKVVLDYANESFSSLHDLRNQIEDMVSGSTGHIRLGLSGVGNDLTYLNDLVIELLLKNPNIKFDYLSLSPEQLQNGLLDRNIDLGISSKVIEHPLIEWKLIAEERIGILLSPDHPLAEKETVTPEDISKERLILVNSNSGSNRSAIEFCSQMGFSPNIFYRLDDARVASTLVHNGYGISFISENRFQADSAAPGDKAPLTFRPICGVDCVQRSYIGTLQGHYRLRIAQILYDQILAHNAEKQPEE